MDRLVVYHHCIIFYIFFYKNFIACLTKSILFELSAEILLGLIKGTVAQNFQKFFLFCLSLLTQ